MRVNREGWIECAKVVIYLPAHNVRKAQQTYPYLSQGVEAEVEAYLGVELEGAERFLVSEDFEGLGVRVIIQADWAPPTRR